MGKRCSGQTARANFWRSVRRAAERQGNVNVAVGAYAFEQDIQDVTDPRLATYRESITPSRFIAVGVPE